MYPLAGLVLAVILAAGLLVVQAATTGAHLGPGFVVEALAEDPATYAYVLLGLAAALVTTGRIVGRREDALEARSLTDPLTGLPNRRQFDQRLAQEMSRARRLGYPLTLLLIDLDRLKEINDEGGHRAGDHALNQVASAIRASARQSDVGARIAGDEFAVIAPATRAGEAHELADRIRRSLAEMGASSTVSVGIADLRAVGDGSEADLTRAADEALYAAKRAGRDRAVTARGSERRSRSRSGFQVVAGRRDSDPPSGDGELDPEEKLEAQATGSDPAIA